jgi:hypothetical protein
VNVCGFKDNEFVNRHELFANDLDDFLDLRLSEHAIRPTATEIRSDSVQKKLACADLSRFFCTVTKVPLRKITPAVPTPLNLLADQHDQNRLEFARPKHKKGRKLLIQPLGIPDKNLLVRASLP